MTAVLIVLAITQLLTLVAILGFFLYREHRYRNDDQRNTQLLKDYFQELNKGKDKVLGDSFGLYLKHIQKLETMVLPKPVTAKMVQEVIDRTPPIVVENEIDRIDRDVINDSPIGGVPFESIPISRDTKVVFDEGNGFPTEIDL